jgi:2-polyprenyl-6-methoxyphenol hydroxylase-like FAD-dependent oxidoreductase
MKKKIFFVGAGPVGLFTAIQLQWLLNKYGLNYEVKFVERNEAYTRYQTVFLDPTSFDEVADTDNEALNALIQELKLHPRIKIQVLEAKLVAIAKAQGMEIDHYAFTTLEQLKKDYPDADMVIGCDGSRSKVREDVFENKLWRKTLQYSLLIKYPVEKGRKLDSVSLYALSKKVPGHYLFEHVQEPASETENDKAQVSLQIFIDSHSYDKLQDKVKHAKGYTLEQLKEDDSKLYQVIKEYLSVRKNQAGEVRADDKMDLSVFAIDCYSSKKGWVYTNGSLVVLNGDALMGWPFLRSINNGFLVGSMLAKSLSEYGIQRDLLQQILRHSGRDDSANVSEEAVKNYYKQQIENKNSPDDIIKREMCALLMAYFAENHKFHATPIRIIPNWDCEVPHLIIKTQGMWNKNRLLYFKSSASGQGEIKDITLSQFSESFSSREALEKYEKQLTSPAKFFGEPLVAYQDLKKCLQDLEYLMSTQTAGPMQRFQADYEYRSNIENFSATVKDSGLGSIQALTKFNAVLPWAFIDVKEDNEGEYRVVGGLQLNSIKVAKFSSRGGGSGSH